MCMLYSLFEIRLFRGQTSMKLPIPKNSLTILTKYSCILPNVLTNVHHCCYQALHPRDGRWDLVDALTRHRDKVTFIEREPVEPYREAAGRLHKMNINIIAGLFFAGGKAALSRLYALQQGLVRDSIRIHV